MQVTTLNCESVILTKGSTENEIKSYFIALLKLSRSDDQYPVNLDEVWTLVYENRSDAVRALKRDFLENEDYLPISKNAELENQRFNPNPKVDYKLSLSCLEYFIARKVRPVFEVYRQVFHKTTTAISRHGNSHIGKRTPALTTKVKASILWVEGVSKCLNLNESSKLALLKQVAEPLGLPVPNYTPSQDTMKSATELLRENGYAMKARVFNQKLIEKGLMEEVTRDSSKGKKKQFKSLTPAGLEYGENQVHPSNPHETQPLYYVHKFNELVDIICKD